MRGNWKEPFEEDEWGVQVKTSVHDAKEYRTDSLLWSAYVIHGFISESDIPFAAHFTFVQNICFNRKKSRTFVISTRLFVFFYKNCLL